MIATLRETWRSLQDLKYGNEIVKKTVGESLWYWSKYLLISSVVGLVISLGILAYLVPQSGGFAEKNFPDLEARIKDGKVETNVQQPFVEGSEEFAIIVNTEGSVDDLDDFNSGLLLLEDKLVAKSDGQMRVVELREFEGLEFNKPMVISWINNNQPTIFVVGMVSVLVLVVLLTAFYWFSRLISFFFSALLIWVGGLLFKKSLPYLDALKITIYGSVLPFLITIVFFAFPNNAMSWLVLVVFLFYSLAWTYNLNPQAKSKK